MEPFSNKWDLIFCWRVSSVSLLLDENYVTM